MFNNDVKKNFFFLIFISVLIVFCVIFIDREVLFYMNGIKQKNTLFYRFFRNITDFGVATWYYIGGMAFYLFFIMIKNILWKNRCLFLLISFVSTGIVVIVLKNFFGRYRPSLLFKKGLYSFTFWGYGDIYSLLSFPSGHATTSFTLAMVFSILFPKNRILFFLFFSFVAVSRVVICAHYVSDIISAAYMSVFITYFIKSLFDKKQIFLHKDSFK